jgi:hypothetical protein
MMDIVSQLKHEARLLQRGAERSDPDALARLAATAGEPPGEIKRRHCLAAVAKEYGFAGWSHLSRVFEGATEGDFGTLLYGPGCTAHSNIWSASYEEARAIREQHGGYLLPYKRQFLIVDRYFIETLGLDPDDPDFALSGLDWVQTQNAEARRRLYAKVIRARAA